jgi:hypothetical protein
MDCSVKKESTEKKPENRTEFKRNYPAGNRHLSFLVPSEINVSA